MTKQTVVGALGSMAHQESADFIRTTQIGTAVQAWSANLDEYAAVNPTSAGLSLLDNVSVSGGVPYGASTSNVLWSAVLGANQLVRGGGDSAAPNTDANLVFDPVNIRLGIGVTPTYNIDLVAPAIAGAESLFRMGVSDAPNDFFAISNTTGVVNRFIPFFRGHVESNAVASLIFVAEALTTQDSGTSPVTWFTSRLQAAGLGAVSNVAVRPTFEWFNNATSQFRLDANNKAVFAGPIDSGGTIRATGAVTPAAGAGVEVIFSSSVGQIYAYDRGASAERDLSLGLGSIYLKADGNNGFGGNVSPTAKMHPAAGTATASTAPAKIPAGTNNTVAEVGAIERTTDKMTLVIETGTARKEFALCDIALTSGRVPYNTTNGRLRDLSGFEFDGAYLKAPEIQFGTHSTIGVETLTGYIPVKDTLGNTRKMAVIS